MKYQDVRKKNSGKTAIIVVISIITVVALAATSFVFYQALSDRAKFLFDDIHNLDVERIEELSGVRFTKDDFSYGPFVVDDFNGEEIDTTFYFYTINLHSNESNTKFEEPSIGDVYNVQIEANGREYSLEKMEIVNYHGKGTVEGYACFDEYLETEIVVYLLPYFYNENVSPFLEVMWHPDSIGTAVKDDRPEGSVEGGYCFVICSLEPLEDIHFVNIEKL